MVNTALTINDGLKKTDSGAIIMNHLTLDVNKGDFITILGGNGAGKSTLFNIISGQMKLTSGQISMDGKQVTSLSEEKRAPLYRESFSGP